MKLLSLIISILFSGSVFAGALDDVKSAGKFVFGLEVGYKPFEYMDDSGTLVGYDIDVSKEVAKRMGVEAVPQDTNWSTVIQTMYDGGFDLILGGMTATEKRYQRVNFSIPYMNAASGIIVMKDSGISDRSDLGGKKVSADDNFTVLAFASDKWSQEWTSMAFTKEDDDLRGAFDDAIRSMKADGALAKLQEKWFGKSFVDTLPDNSPTW